GATSNTAIPENALVVAGNGRYLLPGLTDTHVHIKNENELLLFVAHGVTSVRDMWGTTGWQLTVGYPDQLQMRQQITDGTLLGPSIYTTGPIMEGAPATSPLMSVLDSPEAAIESVNWQAAQGYDYVKVYDHLTPEMYDAIVETAVSHNLPIVGHTPAAVGLDTVLSSGQTTIEHLTGYIDPDAAQFIIPENKLDEYAARTRKAGVWNAPTLGLFTKVVSNDGIRQLESRPELQLVPPNIRLLWPLFVQQLRKGLTYEGDDYPERIAALNTRMVQALNDANAGIILGTDTDNPYLIPGLSALEELELLVEAGLTPYQA
ncbi:MAG: amidohydrolase family protein, partial [Chloroflexi bacterium]|nr:amidohydrolase family protein [Chloroflexota bacterium]